MTDPLEIARIIGRYVNASKQIGYYHVGDGPYGLRAEHEDGSSALMLMGFGSVGDAEAYRSFLRGQLKLDEPLPPPSPRIVSVGGLLGIAPPDTTPRVVRFHVVALVEAVSSDALAGLA